KVGICLSSVLFLFRLLEFSIAVSLAHFGCQAACCANDQAAMVLVPYQVISGYAPVSTEPNSSSPPAYANVVTKPERSDVTGKRKKTPSKTETRVIDNLVVAILPAKMASGNMVVMPSKEANIQTASGLPAPPVQAPGATPYPQHGVQQLGISTSAPQQVPKQSSLERFLKAETKVFGVYMFAICLFEIQYNISIFQAVLRPAVQIMIGLIHIAFGIVV
ncbi:Membrane-spanning 4-domains subfamily A member 8B, partial [Ophiophagus hannah]